MHARNLIMHVYVIIFMMVRIISCGYYNTVPDSEPLLLTASDITSESFYLSWNPPPVEDRNGPITGYAIQVTNFGTGESFTVTSQENSTEIRSLRPFTTYTCVVAAQTSAGIGPYSTTVMIQTDEAGESVYGIVNELDQGLIELGKPLARQ